MAVEVNDSQANQNNDDNVNVDNSLPNYEKKEPKLPFYFNEFLLPGIYAIINTKKNKYYIGEANNLATRMGEHYIQLIHQKHELEKLNTDWKNDGKEAFDFIILKKGYDPWGE